MSVANLPALLALFKSTGDPLLNIAGAYFPAWLACMVAGALGTWLADQILARLGLGAALRPAVLMVPALFALLTCGVWMMFFSAA
jgi:uncharacterized membrane-anchored protein